jgi:hypothetical protein
MKHTDQAVCLQTDNIRTTSRVSVVAIDGTVRLERSRVTKFAVHLVTNNEVNETRKQKVEDRLDFGVLLYTI